MRHALIRLWRLFKLNVKWFVPEGHPTVFDITKRKLHNILQGVAPPGVEITETDKKWFELWTAQNCEAFVFAPIVATLKWQSRHSGVTAHSMQI
jgi:hypothetical protein